MAPLKQTTNNKKKSKKLLLKSNWLWYKPKKTMESNNKQSNSYYNEIIELKKSIDNWNDFFISNDNTSRTSNWIRLEVIGQALCKKYSWAIPNQKSINMLSYFNPLIEIGCGNGYWAYLLRQNNVNIIAVDKYINAKHQWTDIIKGNAKILLTDIAKDRNLFLCYPDDTNSLSMKCLKHFKGEYIIHVGEMITTGGTLSGTPQAPFGRTTAADFQVKLAETFHCLLVAPIPRYPFSNDTISVWKRTTFVKGREDYEDDNEDDEGNEWASIPDDEVLPVQRAAPSLKHLI